MEKFDLKDAIRDGVSPEQMLADFQKQLAEAQHEVAMERAAANSKLDKAREEMIDAILVYTATVGIAPADIIEADDLKADLTETIKEAEKELEASRPLLDMLRRMKADVNKEDRSPDDVIGEFLKSLR